MKADVGWGPGQTVCHLDMALAENAVLTRELGRIQCRLTRFVQEQSGRIQELEAELVRLRAQVIRMLTEKACLEEALQARPASLPQGVVALPRRATAAKVLRRPCAP